MSSYIDGHVVEKRREYWRSHHRYFNSLFQRALAASLIIFRFSTFKYSLTGEVYKRLLASAHTRAPSIKRKIYTRPSDSLSALCFFVNIFCDGIPPSGIQVYLMGQIYTLLFLVYEENNTAGVPCERIPGTNHSFNPFPAGLSVAFTPSLFRGL